MQAGRLSLKAPLMPAIEVWAHVQSRPEPTLVIASLGKRDISYDIDCRFPSNGRGAERARLNTWARTFESKASTISMPA
jgi:D-serine deaminase-like pyridoxal phosphate-dependent protein